MQLLHLKSNSKTWHDGLHDLQLLPIWDEIEFVHQNVYAVGSAYNRSYYTLWIEVSYRLIKEYR